MKKLSAILLALLLMCSACALALSGAGYPAYDGAELRDDALGASFNGESLLLPPKKTGEQHLFVDLLNYVDIKKEELTQDITLKLNGRDAAFLDPLKAGDVADIRSR